MVAKIIKGGNFGGLVKYVTLEMKNARILASEGICTTTPENIISSFSFQSRMNPRLSKFVGHIAFGWSPEDAKMLTEEKMVSAVMDYMRRMDIKDTQYMIVRHFDADHPHVHLVFNLVNNFGKTIPMNNDYIRSEKACHAINLEYGFTGWSWDKKKAKNLDKLRNQEWARENLRQMVLVVLPYCQTWKDFESHLAEVGVRMSFRYSKEERCVVGIVFSTDRFSCGGAKLDPQLKLSALDSMFQKALSPICVKPPLSERHDSSLQSVSASVVDNEKPQVVPHNSAWHTPSRVSAGWLEDFVASGEDSISTTLDMLCEVILMPHVAHTPSAGGGSTSKGEWNDKKKDAREKNNNIQSFRKRR